MADQIGLTLAIGAGTIVGSYIVESRDDGDRDIDMEDIFDENGTRVTRIVFNKDDKITLNLIGLEGVQPEVDFLKGEIAAAGGFTDLYVDDVRITRSKSAKRVTVTLVNIGIT